MVNLVKVMTLLNSIRQVNNNVKKITYEKLLSASLMTHIFLKRKLYNDRMMLNS